MDKTIEQILVEVNFPDEKPFEDMYVGTTNAIAEAMKIFGKQCFDAAKLRHWATDADTYTNFDEYIKELEVRNGKVRQDSRTLSEKRSICTD